MAILFKLRDYQEDITLITISHKIFVRELKKHIGHDVSIDENEQVLKKKVDRVYNVERSTHDEFQGNYYDFPDATGFKGFKGKLTEEVLESLEERLDPQESKDVDILNSFLVKVNEDYERFGAYLVVLKSAQLTYPEHKYTGKKALGRGQMATCVILADSDPGKLKSEVLQEPIFMQVKLVEEKIMSKLTKAEKILRESEDPFVGLFKKILDDYAGGEDEEVGVDDYDAVNSKWIAYRGNARVLEFNKERVKFSFEMPGWDARKVTWTIRRDQLHPQGQRCFDQALALYNKKHHITDTSFDDTFDESYDWTQFGIYAPDLKDLKEENEGGQTFQRNC